MEPRLPAQPVTPATSEETYDASAVTILLRGMTKRCPRCGQGNVFESWTEMRDACPRCGLVFEQEEGYWVGALTYNTMITLILFSLLIGVGAAITWPDTPVLALVGIGVVAGIIVPILFYPFSKTLWVATDLVFFNPWRMRPGTGLRKMR
jgi:uncharacterized protein (DUF983 family)